MTSYISGILLKPFCARCKSKGTLKPVPAVLLQWANLLPGIRRVAPADARWDALCGHIFGVVFTTYWPLCAVCACRLWSQALAPDSFKLSGVLWNSLRAGTASGELEDNWEVSLLNIDSNFTVFSESEPLTGVCSSGGFKELKLRGANSGLLHLCMTCPLGPLTVLSLSFRLALTGKCSLTVPCHNYQRCLFAGAWPMALVGLPLEWARR